jgi:mRNA interferase MazF
VQRGDIYELLAPRNIRGREQLGSRFGVVIQADSLLRLSTWVVAPTSASARAASFRPEIEVNGQPTRLLTEQMTAVDAQRLGEKVGHLSFSELRSVEDAVRAVLDL